MMVFAAPKSPLPSPPPQAGEGTEGPRATMASARAGTPGALRPAPSPACGGGVGRGRVPFALSDGCGPVRPEPQDYADDR
jgi:hypothetical protein